MVLVICPKVAPRNVPFGLLKCGVFVMLKMSTRNSPLTLLEREQLGDRRIQVDVLRAIEHAVAGRIAERVGGRRDEDRGVEPERARTDAAEHAGVPLTSGRCVLPGALSVALHIVIPIGEPDCAEKMPLSCHPPRIWLERPSFSHL